MRKKGYKKLAAWLMAVCVLTGLTFMTEQPMGVYAEDSFDNAATVIPNGDFAISVNGIYQLDEGYSGTITIAGGVTETTVTDAVYRAHHDNTCIVVAGGRMEALELTIEDIDITAPDGMSGIDFGNADSYENKLYISGACSVAGSNFYAGIHVPNGTALVIDKAHEAAGDQLTANGGEYGAGIGGSAYETSGTITINGGTVTANGYMYLDEYSDGDGAGIGGGGGFEGGAGGTVTINGGTVTANGGVLGGAGIGGGHGGAGGIITINGGTVHAAGSVNEGGLTDGIGAGIGGGRDSYIGSTITISGGTVHAAGKGEAAGIGGSLGGIGGMITISGGNVEAAGGSGRHGGGAGIGGGFARTSGTIAIGGGTVTATGGDSFISGAGLGGGGDGAGGTILISGGTIIAAGGHSHSNLYNGAGIGGGGHTFGAGGNVTMTGTPVVYATGDTAAGADNIGQGAGGTDSGTLMDESGADLSYLRFSTAGISGAKIKADGINETYMTNDQGIAGIFTPRSGTAAYTVSKAGYEALRGTQDISLMNHEVDIPMVADNTASRINTVVPLYLSKGTPLEAAFDNDYGIYGILYLVPKAGGTAYADETALKEAAVIHITINSPDTAGEIDTTGLAEGIYQLYLADSAENISEPSEDIIVDNLPEITNSEKEADDTYVDLSLSEGIYGAADGTSELTKDGLQLVFAQNGGTATGTRITAVKKNDGTEEMSATDLTGGENTVRVFLETTGISSGVETIEIKPADGSSIYDATGNAMSEPQTSGAINLKDRQAPTVGNRAIRVSNTRQTGTTLTWNKASDLATTPGGLQYCIYQSSEDNMNTVEDIEANGTVVQGYVSDIGTLKITGLQRDKTYYFNVVVRDSAGNKAYYKTASVTTRTVSSGSSLNDTGLAMEKTVEITIPISELSGEAGRATEIRTELATLTLPSNMLTREEAGNAVFATLTISAVDTSKLPAEMQAQVGKRPVIELTLKLDGKAVSWNNPDAPVTVSIPYKPTAEELAKPDEITIWYIDEAGNVLSVPSGRYDPATGTVTFTTTHFSDYAVVFVVKTFNDLENVAWAGKQIEALAAKGILKGATETEYAPQAGITRSDFLYSLIRTLDIDAKIDENFDDIDKNAYFYKEIAIAKKLGITSGTGNNKFSPDSRITRQDMMVLTDRMLRMLKKFEVQGTASDLDRFFDKSLVAVYAINGVASIVKEGLIVGNGGKVNPLGNTTRAEAAVFLYRIYNEY